jgi:hypothetical protein
VSDLYGSGGRFRWTGALLLLCLVVAIFLQGCGTTVLENVKIQEIRPPDGMLTCEDAPTVPTVDQLSAPDGDNVFSAYIARLEYARLDCWCSVQEMKAYLNKTPVPAMCLKETPDVTNRKVEEQP